MGLAIGARPITFAANVQDVTVPALLLAGTLDTTAPPDISQDAFDMLASTDKTLVLIESAEHRHFDSGLCAQTQSAGAIAAASARAVLDFQTIQTLVTFPMSGNSMDFCGLDTFTDPTDIRPLVTSLSGFDFGSTDVPTTGLLSDDVADEVVGLAVVFFGRTLRGEPERQ